MVKTKSQFRLDAASQKQQGIFKNTSNSLTGALAASAGAIHHATTLPPSNGLKDERLQIKRQQRPDTNQAQEEMQKEDCTH